ncbi:hypothetical protein NNJEOMEG_03162 [Fundidesulfovibrio magnetotacticus]|uniref:PcfJ-like protein n=1 Tax=Fundidesulfovibrio magnetotacticus TaxID=2730080 RepID=A0A6V8LS57_9BACT|nr:PcfJ domain-containing protein [Fundidesulfovibrio magnetotacticus]GFK95303.1 hypothetical protein NNJEOMEG_03162 [Fundidesulfovibrio magnetotacticus]
MKGKKGFTVAEGDFHPLTGTLALTLRERGEREPLRLLVEPPVRGMRVFRRTPGGLVDQGHRLPHALLDAPPGRAHALTGLRAFLSELPPEAVQTARGIAHGQYPCLALLGCHEAARQLWSTCPALLWILGVGIAERPYASDEIAGLLKLSHKALCRALLPGCDARGVTLLRRLRGMAYFLEDFLTLRALLHRPGFLEHAAHLPAVSWPALRMVSDALMGTPRLMASPLFREALARETPDRQALERIREYVQDALRLGARLGIEHPERALRQCPDLSRLRRLHDRWTGQVHALDVGDILGRTALAYPPPPVAGTADILPVTGAAQLHAEGRAMRHCVFSHLEDVLAGRAYVYRMVAPQRATVRIERAGAGWRLGEMRLAGNVLPSDHAVGEAWAWLDRARRAGVRESGTTKA